MFVRTYYLHPHQLASHQRLTGLIATMLFFYIWVGVGVVRRKQESFFDMLLQSSFYIYAFSVLTLTGYFVLFNHISEHNWWHNITERVNNRNGVNFVPLIFMKGHRLLTYDVIGNFCMLIPLGIYLPLLYKRVKNFFSVTFVAMMVSVSIELMQLASNVRITDIDDVILNTAGASVGFILYFIIDRLVIRPLQTSQQMQALS